MDDCSIYFYNPSLAAAILFTALYAIPTVFTMHRILNFRTWYFTIVVVGGVFEVAGYALRIGSVKNVCDLGLYASSQTLIILAPLLVAAGNYTLLGRLDLAVLPVENSVILGLRPTVLTKIFLGVDIISFVIQAVGSGIASSHGWEGNSKDVGVNILLAGLATQLATVIFFLFLLWIFSQRAYFGPHKREGAPDKWEKAFEAVVFSTTMIAARSVYRLIEFALGIDGYPFSNEWPFYVFEATPMLFAITIYCLWFPPGYLPKKRFSELQIEERQNGRAVTEAKHESERYA
ncbi:uncharacterized protein PV09_01871 [Verruconis gallopava]|uniref:Uncharacterized protein n=1 Tax=Verruconis gallopava TaxID=253628 RepID=A0A0D1Z4U8_9PEZI|nr:uncharacterized protein PV09_01871 [Verruconis gallopava]KIW07972.1 hypothetical protein PV09_01871 [Verruconis gallopava]